MLIRIKTGLKCLICPLNEFCFLNSSCSTCFTTSLDTVENIKTAWNPKFYNKGCHCVLNHLQEFHSYENFNSVNSQGVISARSRAFSNWKLRWSSLKSAIIHELHGWIRNAFQRQKYNFERCQSRNCIQTAMGTSVFLKKSYREITIDFKTIFKPVQWVIQQRCCRSHVAAIMVIKQVFSKSLSSEWTWLVTVFNKH